MLNSDKLIIELMRLFSHHVPEFRGRTRFLYSLGSLVSDWPKNEQVTLLGNKFELDLRNRTHRHYYFSLYEKDLLPLVKAWVKSGHIVFDVGANFGFYTILASALVQRFGKVYAFEPAPPAFERLKRHVVMNNAHNVTTENLALGDAPGNASVHMFRDYPDTHASLFKVFGEIVQSFECSVMTLDQYIAQHPEIDHLDFLKVDVEGSEERVFQGGQRSIEQHLPVILFEVNQQALDSASTSEQRIFALLRSFGYQLYWLKGKTLHPLGNLQSPKSYNVCALVPDKHSHLLTGLHLGLQDKLEIR